jgi:hypothetical protein
MPHIFGACLKRVAFEIFPKQFLRRPHNTAAHPHLEFMRRGCPSVLHVSPEQIEATAAMTEKLYLFAKSAIDELNGDPSTTRLPRSLSLC